MTDSPQDRDAPPSVAALAVQVAGLRREVESLKGKAEALADVQREQAAMLEDGAVLRREVEQVLALLGENEDGPTSGWFWLTMTDQKREEKFSELFDWVETVLRLQYPDYLSEQIKPCWPNHPEARWELAWVYQLWSLAYLAKRPSPKDAADWHDRWAPGVIRRLSEVMGRCERACQQQSRRTESVAARLQG